MSAKTERLYRFAPRDRAGWILGLGAAECLTVAGGLLAGTLLASAGAPAALLVLPIAGAGLLTFGRWHGRGLHTWIPVLAAWSLLRVRRQHQWTARIPLFRETGTSNAPPLPPFLAGLEIIEASNAWTRQRRLGSVGLIADRSENLVSGVVRVQGRAFALAERADQDRLLAGWGEVLAGFCRERTALARVSWSEWTAPAGLDDHLRYVDAESSVTDDPHQRRSYLALIDDAAPMTARHEVLVAVTVDTQRVWVSRARTSRDDSLADVVLEELRLLTVRLEDAELSVDVPMSPGELREALRARLDPEVLTDFSLRSRAGYRDALVSEHNFGPIAIDLQLDRVGIDGSWHRGYWIAEWPRLDLHPAWLEPLLLHAGGVRSLAVVYEPIPPSRAQRQIDRDATRLASDEDQRARRGFRIGARHRRAQTAVLEREAELVAGYAELEFAGFLAVTAPSHEQLQVSCAEYEHAAAEAGFELRALDGQHDAGVGACLPIGRYPTRQEVLVAMRREMARHLRVPRHRGTTAHVCSAYPFLAEAGLGPRGVYVGSNVLTGGGSFAYDPFAAYADGLLTNPNVIVAGEVGMGKSTAIKTFVSRSVGMFGRWAAIADPKGEYLPLARALGLSVVKLYPGGQTRLNPLDSGPLGPGEGPDEQARRHSELVAAMVGEVLHRDLHPVEDALLGWVLAHLAHAPGVEEPTLVDVVRLMSDPSADIARRAKMNPEELTRAGAAAIYALGKLVERSLRGMFDGPTTVRVDPDGAGLVLDLSAVFQDRDALGLVLLASTAWLQAVLSRPQGPRRLQVLDEAWALFGNQRTAKYLQSCWKLSRAYGVANIAVIHRLSDLRAQADDGTSTAKIAAGLLADTQTRVLFRQAPDQAPEARELLGLSSVEADLLTRLTRGRALWKVAGRTAVVQHLVGESEHAFCDTNARMVTPD